MDRYNILVVDDEVSNLNALKRALRCEYNVLSATNGRDALFIMEQSRIALIIADYCMPGMTGVQFLEKTLQKYPNTVRVILTAYTDEKLLMDAINTVYVHGFLAKPWEPEEMRSLVGKWIQAHKVYEKYGETVNQLKEYVWQKDEQIESLQRQLEETQKSALQALEKLEQRGNTGASAPVEMSQRHDSLDKSKCPTFKYFTDGEIKTFWCPYCKRWHNHSHGNGYRAAHCENLSSPLLETDYMIRPYSKAELKEMKKMCEYMLKRP